MKNNEILKENIKKTISSKLSNFKEIVSATIVGSFYHEKSLDFMSDIDIVVIVKELDKILFDKILFEIAKIDLSELEIDGTKLIINSTFGPLKLKVENSIVFHLMIYDIKGHIEHVEKSPFTCFSWEQYRPIIGLSLREVYPVLNLKIEDLLNSRRSIKTYLSDIKNGSISFKKYVFCSNKARIKNCNYTLSENQKKEFSFHVIHHLLINLYRVINFNKKAPSIEKIKSFYLKNKLLSKEYVLIYECLYKWKKNNTGIKNDYFSHVKKFLDKFIEILNFIDQESSVTKIIRHQKTQKNDGSFLGQKIDPDILKSKIELENDYFDFGFHSELKRSYQTIKLFSCSNLVESSLLNEIDYGDAEGLNIAEFEKKYNHIVFDWKKRKDPPFPKGESQSDVLKRVEKFFQKEINFGFQNLIITHLVVLRVILRLFLGVEIYNLHKIQIPFLNGFVLKTFKEKSFLELNGDLRKEVRSSLSFKRYD